MRIIFALTMTAALAATATPREQCSELKKTARLTVYFDKVEIEKLVQTVSDATCRSFLLGENVKGKISIIGPENGKVMLDAQQFYAAFLAALDVNGLAAVPQGRFVRIIEKTRARNHPSPLLQEGDPIGSENEMVTRIFRLHHLDVERRGPLSPRC